MKMTKKVRIRGAGFATLCIPEGVKMDVGSTYRSRDANGRYVDFVVVEILDEHSCLADVVGFGMDLRAA